MASMALVLLVLFVFAALYMVLQWALGKWLHLESRRKFPTFYNETHWKWHRIMCWVSLGILISSFIWVMILQGGDESLWFVLLFAMFASITIPELCRAYMEWKYSEQRKEYIRVLLSVAYLLSFMMILYVTDFFWIS
ncbi:DUF4181 domain-containing protein [Rossellomorea marisflavi]|uniref:DUF4181 domain-containing protein n=1 Tax=Rossellomorea marisflavi TaxID=189381 RepID=UPI0034583E49